VSDLHQVIVRTLTRSEGGIADRGIADAEVAQLPAERLSHPLMAASYRFGRVCIIVWAGVNMPGLSVSRLFNRRHEN
jgi:hypothetical protein